MIKVVLAENQKIMREGIRLILEKDSDICVVGAAPSFELALTLCEQQNPDVLLLGAELARSNEHDQIQGGAPFTETKVILIANSHDSEKMAWAISQGVCGYVSREIDPKELVMTVKIVAMGLSVMHGESLLNIAGYMHSAHNHQGSGEKQELPASLTKRETDVIREIISGKENREIARSLYISEGTVKNTISSILKKLNLKTRVQLAIFALRNDLDA